MFVLPLLSVLVHKAMFMYMYLSMRAVDKMYSGGPEVVVCRTLSVYLASWSTLLEVGVEFLYACAILSYAAAWCPRPAPALRMSCGHRVTIVHNVNVLYMLLCMLMDENRPQVMNI